MANNREKLQTPRGEVAITFVETQAVKEGVEADLYEFADDDSKDLAIVRVAAPATKRRCSESSKEQKRLKLI